MTILSQRANSLDIALIVTRTPTRYVEGQAPDEEVQHVERVKREIVLGDVHEIWDVTTDKDRWWAVSYTHLRAHET